jgi:hypothetical protein
MNWIMSYRILQILTALCFGADVQILILARKCLSFFLLYISSPFLQRSPSLSVFPIFLTIAISLCIAKKEKRSEQFTKFCLLIKKSPIHFPYLAETEIYEDEEKLRRKTSIPTV